MLQWVISSICSFFQAERGRGDHQSQEASSFGDPECTAAPRVTQAKEITIQSRVVKCRTCLACMVHGQCAVRHGDVGDPYVSC